MGCLMLGRENGGRRSVNGERNRGAAENEEFAGDLLRRKSEVRSPELRATAQVERSEIPRLKEFGIPRAISDSGTETKKITLRSLRNLCDSAWSIKKSYFLTFSFSHFLNNLITHSRIAFSSRDLRFAPITK